jgi:hypothetical protein
VKLKPTTVMNKLISENFRKDTIGTGETLTRE